MRLLKLTFLFFLLSLVNPLQAQLNWSHSIGTGVEFSNYTIGYNIGYAPRANLFKVGNQGCFSVGSDFTLGYGFGFNPFFDGDMDVYYGGPGVLVKVPVLASLNFGHACDDEAWSDFGAFIGAGGAIQYTSLKDGYDNRAPMNSGLYFNAGFRVGLGVISTTYQASYLLNYNKGGSNVLALSVLFNVNTWE